VRAIVSFSVSLLLPRWRRDAHLRPTRAVSSFFHVHQDLPVKRISTVDNAREREPAFLFFVRFFGGGGERTRISL